MAFSRMIVVVLASLSAIDAVNQQDNAALATNPIRKVVTMLQAMQKKVTAEGEKEAALYAKFMCYCKNGAGDLSKSIGEAQTKMPILGSDISEAVAKKKQLGEDLNNHQADRVAAKSAMSMATVLRERAAAAFAKDKSSADSNIAALDAAIAAISKGMSGAFLQTSTAQVLKKLILNQDTLLDADRQDIMSFLSGGQDGQYAPQSGEIVGVLKSVKDLMSQNLAQSTATEAAAIAAHDQLMAAKTKELDANSKAIEMKSVRVGELAVNTAQMKTDLSDTDRGLSQDQKFLSDLDTNCGTQTKEWEERSKTRSDELLALADTIKVLNDDDALDLFKKALPGASSSFVQLAEGESITRQHALSLIRSVKANSDHRPQFDFITLALHGKAIGFKQVIKMVDGMIVTLKDEQAGDDHKREYCAKQFDFSDEKRKGLAKSISDLAISIREATDGVATLKEEIDALEDGIKALDTSVTDSTEQRKSEHEDFTSLMASDAAAKELLKFATNRLNKFYHPTLPAQAASASLVQVSAHGAPPAPAAFDAYAAKKDEIGNVLAMIQLLVKGLDKEMTESQVAEQDAQKDYEQMLNDSADKRANDSKALTDKNISKASMEADIEASKESKASTGAEMMATDKYVALLHGECDWLLQYFDVRREARTAEIDGLANAKSVLQGADVSLLQRQSRNLRRR